MSGNHAAGRADVESRESGNWLSLLLVGLCGLGVGVGASLGIVAMTGKSIREAIAERDRAVATAADAQRIQNDAQRASDEAKRDVEKLRKEAELAKKLTDEVNAEHAEQLKKAHEEIAEIFVQAAKSQALICLVRDIDGMRDVLRDKEFRARFRPNWFAPDESLKLLGGRWFVDELLEFGLVDEKVAHGADSPSLEKAGAKWRVVKQWHTAGSKDTETFQITSRVWKISWTSRSPVGVS